MTTFLTFMEFDFTQMLRTLKKVLMEVGFHIELNKGGKRTFANFQAKTQYFRSRF